MIFLITIFTILFHFSAAWGSAELEVPRTCEPIKIDMCQDIGYNVTGMPNFVGHDRQQDAQMQIQTFMPLIQYGCSSRLGFFLCSTYVPMCTDKVPQPIGPCRRLCESVKELCEPVLREFGFQWPPSLNCSQFAPVNNDKHMCMEGPEKEEKAPIQRDRWPYRSDRKDASGYSNSYSRHNRYSYAHKMMSHNKCRHLRAYDQYYFVNETRRCVASCHATILYSPVNKDFAEIWMAVWTGVCLVSTLFTLVMFFMSPDRYRYPERIIIICICCYFLCGLGYTYRLILGREHTACYWSNLHKESLLVQTGLPNFNCTLVFVLLYYFGMASTIWWVILTLNWFLTAGLDWNTEIMERLKNYFHVVAWSIPAVKTIAILVMDGVDAEELTGICFVGNHNSEFLVRFVIIPYLTYLTVGVIFLVAGSLAIYKNKSYRLKVLTAVDKWDSIMIRLGIFAFPNIIPVTCILVANFIDFTTRDELLESNSSKHANIELAILKVFMSLCVGITSGFWWYTSRSPQPRPKIPRNVCSRSQRTTNSQNQVLLRENYPHKITVV